MSDPTPRNFKQIASRFLAISCVLAVVFWMLFSPQSPYALGSRQSSERLLSEAMRESVGDHHDWIAEQGIWQFRDSALELATQQLSTAEEAQDAFRKPPSASLQVNRSQEQQAVVESFLALNPVMVETDSFRQRVVNKHGFALALFTTTEDEFLTIRMLYRDKNAWTLISAVPTVPYDESDFPKLPPRCTVMATRCGEGGALTAKILQTVEEQRLLNEFWREEGWRIERSSKERQEWVAQRGSGIVSIVRSENREGADTIMVIRVLGDRSSS